MRIVDVADWLDKPLPPRTYSDQKLRTLLRDLSEPALVELTALMWYGRGDGGSWRDHLAYARKTSRGPGEIDYIAGKPLETYLPQALARIAAASFAP